MGDYPDRPAGLDQAHRELDSAVAAAYGWPEDIPEQDALRELLELNAEADQGGAGVGPKSVEGT